MMSTPGSRLDRRKVRREEAKRQREEARRRQRRSGMLMRVALIAGAAAVLAGVVVAVVLSQRREAPVQARAVPIEAECNQPAPIVCSHLNEGEPYTKYNNIPPTSGPHWPAAAPWGVYTAPQPFQRLVHNLEHGGIVVYYNCRDCPDLVEDLKEVTGRFRKTVLAPYYDMQSRIAVTSWGYIDEMDTFDRARILSFIRAYYDRGPESVQ